MTIYKNREEALKAIDDRKKELKAQHINYGVSEGSISLCGLNGERKYRTIELDYERYDDIDGWMDCVAIVAYAE